MTKNNRKKYTFLKGRNFKTRWGENNWLSKTPLFVRCVTSQKAALVSMVMSKVMTSEGVGRGIKLAGLHNIDP